MTEMPVVTVTGGVAMPLLGFGTWQLTGDQAYRAVRAALDVGYRHLDTATGYGNEAEVGRAVRDSGVDRGDVFITTKLPPDQADRARETLERSRRALGVDAVDLWLIHWPPNGRARPDTWRELLAARDEGLIRAAGVSNYGTGQLDELIDATGEAPAVNQIKWGPSLYDPKQVAEHRERGVALEGYSPFKTTDLTDPVLTDLAGRYGVTAAQVVLRWHLDHGVVVIPKSATADRIRANFDVLGFSLTEEERDRVDGLAGHR
jgi:2,5-diketo-D-gluconate reductase A